jgi:hypothetical protein
MADDRSQQIVLIRQADRRKADRRCEKRPGGRRVSDLGGFAICSEGSWPSGALELWPDLPRLGRNHSVTIH